MINELIIILTDQQQAELIKRMKADNEFLDENVDDDMWYLQNHINIWLKLDRDREHTEK